MEFTKPVLCSRPLAHYLATQCQQELFSFGPLFCWSSEQTGAGSIYILGMKSEPGLATLQPTRFVAFCPLVASFHCSPSSLRKKTQEEKKAIGTLRQVQSVVVGDRISLVQLSNTIKATIFGRGLPLPAENQRPLRLVGQP